MVATEPGVKPAVTHSYHERWADNERMRHVPSLEWIARKVDGDIRRRIDILLSSAREVPAGDPVHEELDDALRMLCRGLERVAEVARHGRSNNNHHGGAAEQVEHALEHAVTNLRSVDPNTFGRRLPFHTFERSNAEPLYAAVVIVLREVDAVLEILRDVDPDIDEHLLKGLVVLSNPVDERMLQPIA